MAKDYTVLTSIICDDIRQEADGKAIIIGVYARALSVPYFPITAPTFGVYIEITGTKHEYNKAVISIRSPDGSEMVRGESTVRIKYLQFPTSLIFKFEAVQLKTAGEYKVYLGIDTEPELVSTFFVGTREGLISQPA